MSILCVIVLECTKHKDVINRMNKLHVDVQFWKGNRNVAHVDQRVYLLIWCVFVDQYTGDE